MGCAPIVARLQQQHFLNFPECLVQRTIATRFDGTDTPPRSYCFLQCAARCEHTGRSEANKFGGTTLGWEANEEVARDAMRIVSLDHVLNGVVVSNHMYWGRATWSSNWE